jgi:hypothetical protein
MMNRLTGVHRRETYDEACRANWPRATCTECHVPMIWNSAGMCQACRRDDTAQRYRLQPATLLPKEKP